MKAWTILRAAWVLRFIASVVIATAVVVLFVCLFDLAMWWSIWFFFMR